VGLAGDVLALHRAIQEVTVVETRAGELHVVDQAARNGTRSLEAVSEREREIITVAPTLIFGAASQLGNAENAGRPRLIGLLYERRGTLCVPITEDSFLMTTTASETFLDVMKTLQDMLPKIVQKRDNAPESLTIASAIEADQAIRSFFANTRLCEPDGVQLDDATLNAGEHSWKISGTYHAPHALRSKRYYIELDARTGAVTKFQART
jgi:hypothetical protein